MRWNFDVAPLLLVTFLLAIISALLNSVGGTLLSQGRSLSYHQCQGTVLSSQVLERTGSEGDKVPYAEVNYTYEVAGKRYESQRIAYRLITLLTPGELQANYRQGTDVTVYYSPTNPSESVLRPGFAGMELASLTFCATFLALAGLQLGEAFGLTSWEKELVWLEITSQPDQPRLRLRRRPPFEVVGWLFTTVGMVISIVQLLLFALLQKLFDVGASTILAIGLAGWVVLVGLIIGGTIRTLRSYRRGEGDLWIRKGEGIVDCPSWPDGPMRRVALQDIRGVYVHEGPADDLNFVVVLDVRNGPELPVHAWKTEGPAQALRTWLESRLLLKQTLD